jgi:hypothetical protein
MTTRPPGCCHAAGVPRLFDLVKCRDERLRVAFYYAVRDTVVARDLDQASRIAYGQDKRWRRVVTLKVLALGSHGAERRNRMGGVRESARCGAAVPPPRSSPIQLGIRALTRTSSQLL